MAVFLGSNTSEGLTQQTKRKVQKEVISKKKRQPYKKSDVKKDKTVGTF